MKNMNLILALVIAFAVQVATSAQEIIHDAEQVLLQEQYGEQWAEQDKEIDKQLKALEKKHGKKPNIIHIMWDDNSFGEVGIKEFNYIRGFKTPHLNQMADEGMTFTRMYSEPSCTPTRAACLTGRLAVRSGMHTVSFPPEGAGLPEEEVTIAEVLSEVGYSTCFIGKGHQGDIEEAYLHNQGFDEARFSMYNQFPPIFWNEDGEAANFTIGYNEERWEKDYLVDHYWRPKGYIMEIQGKKGEKARETLAPSLDNYRQINKEHQDDALSYIRRKADDDNPFYLAYWPNVYDLNKRGQTMTTSNATPFAQNIELLDQYIGQIVEELRELGISENTLIVAMADNGPMTEVPSAMYQVVFNGGKGDYREGGIK
ncbi:sulfatase-like hydrolase/transferase [Labilibacter marinus]|uniref:sulfatase-like hydrolase/transferase n=1 Tax=Labilibacter marinus TaxID=1477105 RepID=UPI000B14836F|nr:sulfatase-like hydrolase/transferase [Labilibacter marinus]